MQNTNLKICLLYTTYHSFIWDLISGEISNDDITVVNFSKRVLKNKNSKIPAIEFTEKTRLAFLLACVIVALKSKFKKYDLLIPHPGTVLGNTLFFSKNIQKITLIEDGILNYYDYKSSHEMNRKAAKRRALTWLTPFRYYLYKGHHSGIDDCPAIELSGWFTDPEKVIKRERFNELHKINFPVQAKNAISRNPIALLLDQPLEKFLSAGIAKKIRKKSISYLEENFSGVMVKPHPGHKLQCLTVKNQIALNIDLDTPIEEVICQIQPDTIISYCSSALVNIAKILPNTNCISVGMDEIAQEIPSMLKIKVLFECNKIKII